MISGWRGGHFSFLFNRVGGFGARGLRGAGSVDGSADAGLRAARRCVHQMRACARAVTATSTAAVTTGFGSLCEGDRGCQQEQGKR